jgi:hypothetical protein
VRVSDRTKGKARMRRRDTRRNSRGKEGGKRAVGVGETAVMRMEMGKVDTRAVGRWAVVGWAMGRRRWREL